MMYDVVISEIAEVDIDGIHIYISEEHCSPKAADALLDKFEHCILDLRQMPNRYSLVAHDRLARKGIRSVPVKNYIIFYYADEQAKTVTITRVMYGKRDWANLLQ